MCENAKIDISSAGFYIFAMAFMIIGGIFTHMVQGAACSGFCWEDITVRGLRLRHGTDAAWALRLIFCSGIGGVNANAKLDNFAVLEYHEYILILPEKT